jgi:hypothetical protein
MDTPTLPAEDRYIQTVALEGETTYDFDFPAYDVASVQLFVDNFRWKFSEDYSVALNGLDGGTVTLIRGATTGQILTIVGATPYIRTEHYVPPVADVATLNIEGDKTIYRLQQLNRDILGCLKNRRDETKCENTELPKTVSRKGKFAVWGSGSGRLTYAGDPTEGGDDPTATYAKTYNNLSDLTDPAAARENLKIIQGHVVNGLAQRPGLTISGAGVSVFNDAATDATVVSIVQTVQSFADLSGVAALSQGGTGANNAIDARKNLGLAKVAETGNFSDLSNRPYIISHIVSSGSGVSLVGTMINGIAAILSLTTDGTIGIREAYGHDSIELSIAAVPVGKISGVLPPSHGGTGLGQEQLTAADAGTVLTLNVNRTFDLQSVPKSGHQIWDETTPLPQRSRLRFVGDGVQGSDDAATDSTVVTFAGSGGTAGRYFAHLFFASEFDGNTLTVQQAAIPFPISDPLLAIRDGDGNYVEAGIAVQNGSQIQITASPFDGKLLVCEPGGSGFGFFSTIPFAENDFSNNRLVIGQEKIPFELVDPMVAVVDSEGIYVNCAISIETHVALTITAKPFSGKLLLFRGDLQQVYGRHKILGPNGDEISDRLRLEFTGDGVQSVANSSGKTVVTISGGGGSGGKLATVDFSAEDFTGTTLVISAQVIPFSYGTPIVQVTNTLGQYGVAAVTVDPDTRDIVVEGEPFAGRLILMSN